MKKIVMVKARCLFCGYEIIYKVSVNEFGFFAVPNAYCPNDFAQLDQVINTPVKKEK